VRTVDGTGPRLLLGPVLRYVDESRATVWVETDRPCVVRVLGSQERTWTVHGHHYALLVLAGLAAASETPYEVHVDDVRVWPEPDSRFPASVIRTFRHDEAFRLSFGSCRQSGPYDEEGLKRYGADALVALAERMATTPTQQWTDALLLVGDQVYADDPSPHLITRLRDLPAHHQHDDIRNEMRDFEGYTWLYHESWSKPAVRWLLSTVPSCMLLDDHDLRDDWNTSWAWRQYVTSRPWWRNRVVGAFSSYWVYQHLGNLSPEQLARDEMFGAMRSIRDDEQRSRTLDAFAWRSDTEPHTARWSFYRDFGDPRLGIRLVAIDARCSRRLDPDDRAMLDEDEWQWVVDQALHARHGERIDHLLLASTLPFLLLHGIHHLEGWNEAVARGAWGRTCAWLGEHLRQAVDLEHWAAFRNSFDGLVELLQRIVTSDTAPASVLILSGDVHCSYTARARLIDVQHPDTAVHQLTMSPFRNPMEWPLRAANWAFEQPLVRSVWHRIARLAGVPDVAIEWDIDHGPWFDNGLMTVILDGRAARVEVEHASVRDDRQQLSRTLSESLT
jgi:phosphodiesterase/alkaline phosphatase D-like protein